MKYIYWTDVKKTTAITTTSNLDGRDFNMAYHATTDKKSVKDNRVVLLKDLSLNDSDVVYVHQSHSDTIKKVSFADGGKGSNAFEDGVEADAIYTYDKGLTLAVFHADCVPVFVSVPKKHLVMIIHAGEEGTLKEITYKAIETLVDIEHINPKHIYAYLGPSKSSMSNSVNKKIIDEANRLGYYMGTKQTNKSYYIDTQLINYEQLIKAGVLPKNITTSKLCTFERDDLFYSCQRDKKCGRMISLIKMDN